MRPSLPSAFLLATSALLLAACGGDSFSSQSGGVGDAGTGSGGDGSGSGGESASGGSSAGSASGAGGRAAGGRSAGGGVSSGGVTASGGAGAGGEPGSGGTTSSGGKPGSGGTTSSGGTLAAGGIFGAGGDVGTGGSGGSVCPPSQPSGDCEDEGQQCIYGECCPAYAMCSGGQWLIAMPPCALPTCPDAPPTNGTSCACMEGISCDYDLCQNGGGQAAAVCQDAHWAVTVSPTCGDPCVDVGCADGTTCVATYKSGSTEWSYGCVDAVCLPGGSRCDCFCAGSDSCRELLSGGFACTQR